MAAVQIPLKKDLRAIVKNFFNVGNFAHFEPFEFFCLRQSNNSKKRKERKILASFFLALTVKRVTFAQANVSVNGH